MTNQGWPSTLSHLASCSSFVMIKQNTENLLGWIFKSRI